MSICTTAKQFREFGKLYIELQVAVLEEIVEITGCKKPCTYNEYKFNSSTPIEDTQTQTPEDEIFIGFWAVSRTTQVATSVIKLF